MKKNFLMTGLLLILMNLVNAQNNDAYFAFANNEYAKAKNLFLSDYKKSPSDIQAQLNVAKCYAMLSQKDSALHFYNLVNNTDTKGLLKNISSGALLYFNNNKTEPKKMFEEVITRGKGKDANIPFEIACIYLSPINKNIDEAIYYLNKSKEIDFKNPNTLIVLGDAYLEKGDAGKAMNNFEQALMYKKSSLVYYKMGQVYINAKNNEQAISALNNAIAIDPNFADAYDKLGEAYYLNGQFNKVAENFKKYAELKPNDTDAKLRLVNFLYIKEDFKNLKKEIPNLLKADPSLSQLNRLMGYACYETAAYDSSLLFMNNFMEQAKNQNKKIVARDYMYLAKAQIKTKNDSLGLLNLSEAMKLDDGSNKKEIITLMSESYYDRKDWNNTITYINLKEKEDALTATDIFKLGRAYYMLKDYTMADTTYGRFIAQRPSLGLGWYWRAKTKTKMDDAKNPIGLAESFYQKFIELASNDVEKNKKDLIDSYSQLGFIYYVRKNNAEAKNMYNKVLELDPNNTQAKNNLEALK